MTIFDPDAALHELETTPADLARFALLAQPRSLFAIVDAAREDDTLDLLARSGERYRCLLLDPTPEDIAYDAPYLVLFSAGSTLLADLLAVGWAKGWACFLTSAAGFDDVYGHFEAVLREDPLVHDGAPARVVEPRVLAAKLMSATPEVARRLFGPASAFLVEGARAEVLLRFVEGDDGVRVEETVLSLGREA